MFFPFPFLFFDSLRQIEYHNMMEYQKKSLNYLILQYSNCIKLPNNGNFVGSRLFVMNLIKKRLASITRYKYHTMLNNVHILSCECHLYYSL